MTNTVGTLYLVATPIGNLEDFTFRGVRTLKEVDFLYCEDTRRASILLRHFEIVPKNRAQSFHDHSSKNEIVKISKLLMSGKNVGYITDGGMPVVSDPGFVLVRAAVELGAPVVVIPGPSAASTLFVCSALPSPKYFFHGFFPRTKGELDKVFEVLRENPVVHVFYEAPNRIRSTFEVLNRNFPHSQAVLGRELTKMHEELFRGSVEKIHQLLEERETVKGECVFAILGGHEAPKKIEKGVADLRENSENAQEQNQKVELTAEQQAEITSLIQSGVSSKDAAKELSKKFRVPRRIVYEFIIRHLT